MSDVFMGASNNKGWNPVAIIDIGSNSVRLVVYDHIKRHPSIIFNEKVSCGLGRGLQKNGKLGKEEMRRALAAMKRYSAIIKNLRCKTVFGIATAASREASNGPEFIAKARKICQCDISVISGEEEAQLAATGIVSGFYKVDGIVGDMGGGSLELLNINHNNISGGDTLKLGGLSLIDTSGGDLEKAAKISRKALDSLDWLDIGQDRPFYAVGGTWRAFARMYMGQIDYPFHVLHGYSIEGEKALKFAHLLDHVSPEKMPEFKLFSKPRRETIAYGAIVLSEYIKKVKPSKIYFSSYGVREGAVYRLLQEEEREKDPLLAACRDMARRNARCIMQTSELFDWTSQLFTAPGPIEDEKNRRLRHAACLLSDIGWRAHSDFRAEQTMDIIAHSDLTGISHRGRAFLALAVYYRYSSPKKKPADKILMKLLPKQDYKDARILGAALRVINKIAIATPGITDATRISYGNNKIILHLPQEYAVLDGESLDKRMRQLAELLDMNYKIKYSD